jgi:excisionase family DNA binding protein
MGDSSVVQHEAGSGAYAAVAELLEHGNAMTLTDSTGAKAELPADTAALLRTAVAEILHGRTPQIVSSDQTVSTQQAAQVLGISRPTLVKLLEDGAIKYERPGGVHRRVSVAALAEYQERIASRRMELLAEMAQEAAEDDAYEHGNGFVQTR